MLYIGIDVGTQSCKALVWDSASKRVVGRGQFAYRTGIRHSIVVGRMEQECSDWVEV